MAVKQVLWSGGLDSTYLIYKLLCEKHHVEAFYVDLKNNAAKAKRELAAIKKLAKLFSKYDFKYSGVLSEFRLKHIEKDNPVGFYQSPVWLLSAYYLKGPVSIGYVMNDDAISYIDDYKKIIKSLNAIRFSPLEIDFPLTKTSKRDILAALPKEFLGCITYCESEGIQDKCGKCGPCKRHNALLESDTLKIGKKEEKPNDN
jgi:7-cyano-7-deazaguanine synthase in queuosine biosynthesis